MNLVLSLDQLQKARRFVRDGREHLSRQRKIVAELEHQGLDALDDILHLECLEEMQEVYLAHQDQLEAQVLGLLKPAEDED